MTVKNSLITFGSIILTLIFAPMIDTFNHAQAFPDNIYTVPLVFRFLGEARSMVSTWVFLQADVYFHGGVTHCTGCDGGDSSIRNNRETPYITPLNILPRLSERISVASHIHLKGEQLKEIIPWLYFAAKIDPQNTEAYTLTAFYLADMLGKKEDALNFLREGLKNNIDSWEINAEIGRIYFQYFKDYKKAVCFLSRGASLQNEKQHDKIQERYVLTFLAASYDAMGENGEAVKIYNRLVKLFPDEKAYGLKINQIKPQ